MWHFTFRCLFAQSTRLFVPTTSRGAVPRGLRLHGTVTAFKHRRGYGFVLAEGVVNTPKPPAVAARTEAAPGEQPLARVEPANTAGTEWLGEYFFTRGSLGGGFYVTEGERVSFGVRPLTAEQLEARRQNAVRRGQPAEADAGEGDASGASSALHVASRVRFYDLKTGTESAVTPPTLCGKITLWDEAKGEGVVAELDTRGHFHEDAPRFAFTLEDTDLADGTTLREGRFVRFAAATTGTPLASASDDVEVETPTLKTAPAAGGGASGTDALPRAERVIIDTGNERRHAVRGSPISPDTATTRFHGVIRDIVDGKYGFILDDLSGDSIFFHVHNTARGCHLSTGDRVSYLLREISMGKHTGKKTCLNVRPEQSEASIDAPSTNSSIGAESVAGHASHASASGFAKTPHAASQRTRRSPVEDDDDDDFSLLD